MFSFFLHYGDLIFSTLGEVSRNENSIYPRGRQRSTPSLRNVILTIIRRSFDHPHLEKSVNGTLNVHLYGTSSEEEVLQLSHTIEVEPSTKHFLKVSTQSFCSNLKTHETPLNRKATKNQLKMFIYSETSREDANELSKWRFFFIFN